MFANCMSPTDVIKVHRFSPFHLILIYSNRLVEQRCYDIACTLELYVVFTNHFFPSSSQFCQPGGNSISHNDITYGKISQSLELAKPVVLSFPIALKCSKHLGSTAAEMPAKFKIDEHFNTWFRAFKTLCLTIRHLVRYWIGPQSIMYKLISCVK